jgi:phosphate:Na+ symporter
MLEARQSIAQLGQIIARMFADVSDLFREKDDRRFAKIHRRIARHEDLIDAFRARINEFLTNLSADDLSVAASRKVSAMRFISDNLENIGDRCFELSRIISQKRERKVWFHQEQREGIQILFHLVAEALYIMNANLGLDYDSVKPEEALDAEKKVDEQRNALVEAYLLEISQGTHRADAGNYFRDLYSIAERIGDHAINITEVMLSSQQKNKRAKT